VNAPHSHCKSSSNDWGLAERTLKLDFKPLIYAFAMELMSAAKSLDHHSLFKSIQANGAVLWFSILCRFINESVVGVDNVSYFFWWELRFFLFFLVISHIIVLFIEGFWIFILVSAICSTVWAAVLILKCLLEMSRCWCINVYIISAEINYNIWVATSWVDSLQYWIDKIMNI